MLCYQRLADAALPWAIVGTVILTVAGLYLSWSAAPAGDYQDDAYRIIFVHAPAVWMTLLICGAMAIASVIFIIWRHPLAETAAGAAAPIGAVFTANALIIGSAQRQLMWGTYWDWDASRISLLLLFCLYVTYLALQNAFSDPARGAHVASIFCIVGTVSLSIIYYLITWRNEAQSTFLCSCGHPSNTSIHPGILAALLVMLGAYLCFFVSVHTLQTRAGLAKRKIRNLKADFLD
ncbi:MAG: cytochrome c biogenesis protein CcsA [Geminicoccaceae bacterium]